MVMLSGQKSEKTFPLQLSECLVDEELFIKGENVNFTLTSHRAATKK